MTVSHIDILLEGLRVEARRPWRRTIVSRDSWELASTHLAEGRLSLLGLWGDGSTVNMALLDEEPFDIGVLTLACADGRFPSVGAVHPPAIRLERTVRDLYGLEPEGLPDQRPWLDHGRWGVQHPLGAEPNALPAAVKYSFLPVEGESLHQIPVGPVHAGIIEPGHFRFTANGEAVVRLEQRLGYVHKGIEALMVGADLERGSRLAGRTSGDSTVAYGLAFAHAAEAALGLQIPPRAAWLRALMAELERLANHFGDFGAVCNDASFSIMHAQTGVLRERTLRAAAAGFGHRLMMDRVVPGGVTCDLTNDAREMLAAMLDDATTRFAEVARVYDATPSLQDRTCLTGIVAPDLVARWAAGGFVGRASGRAFDARRELAYPPYFGMEFAVPTFTAGDVNARVWVRIREVEESARLLRHWLWSTVEGPLRAEVPLIAEPREGVAVAEAFRGDVFVWLRLAGGRVQSAHVRDASVFQWPLLEAAIEGNIVADFPLCNKSFNCSYSGHDQ
jgi:Ni,Fe-hydrogenase III large subunit